MNKIVDTKGKACPEPVIMTKNALSEIDEGVVTVVVDSDASRENVKRFAESQGCTVTVREKDGCVELDIAKGYACTVNHGSEKELTEKNGKVVFVCSESLGGDPVLGKKLMEGFIANILEQEPVDYPEQIIFVNDGVKICCFWEDTIKVLKKLEEKGVQVFACGVCLEFFEVEDKLSVGKVGNAFSTVQTLMQSKGVIRLG